MSLGQKLSICSALAASALYSGCESVPSRSASEQQALEERWIGAILGGALVNRGVQRENAGMIAVGDNIIGSSVSRVPQTNVHIYGNNSGIGQQPMIQTQPVFQPTQPSSTLMIFADGWADLDHNGVITYPQEFINPGKATFKVNGVARAVIYGRNNPQYILKGTVRDAVTNDVVHESSNINMPPSSMVPWILPSDKPGLYSLTITNQHSHTLGEALFEIKN